MNLITEIGEMVSRAIQAQLDTQSETVTLTTIEQTTRQLIQTIGQMAIEQVLVQASQYPDPIVICSCGSTAPYVRLRPAVLHTLFGKVKLKRAYYLCKQCHQGCYPLDQKMGLRPNGLSAEVARLAALTGVQLPFQTGCDLFKALTLVDVSDQSMGKATRAVGQLVAAQEKAQLAATNDEEQMLQRQREAQRPRRLYGSLDATKVHIRDDETHRWRDLKVGAWYEAKGKPPQSPDETWRIVASNISYYADICKAQQFGDLLWSTGVKRHAQLAHELILIGDGAEWIWNLADIHYPDAIQILDWFHASEHLMPVAQAAFQQPEKQTEWVQEMRHHLWQGAVESVITICRQLHEKQGHDVMRKTANYFETHANRMRYDYFRSQGYQIGSGTIESAAKQIGMMRLKVAGAIWNEAHARSVAKARAAYLSNGWSDLPLAV